MSWSLVFISFSIFSQILFLSITCDIFYLFFYHAFAQIITISFLFRIIAIAYFNKIIFNFFLSWNFLSGLFLFIKLLSHLKIILFENILRCFPSIMLMSESLVLHEIYHSTFLHILTNIFNFSFIEFFTPQT